MGHFLHVSTNDALSRLAGIDADPATSPLERLRGIRLLVRALETDAATLVAVREALTQGLGWGDIAGACGVKPAAAKWRWAGSDEEIAARHEAGRKRSARPSSVPVDLPGLSVAEAAIALNVTPQAIYLQISRGRLSSQSVELPDGRRYKRVFLPERGGVLDQQEGAQHNGPRTNSTDDNRMTE
jgi:hypothetical protein